MLAVGGTPHQELITEFGHKRWRLGAQNLGHVVRGHGAGCIAPGEVVADRLSGRVDVRGRHPLDRRILVQHIDGAPVGDGGNSQSGDLAERGLVVE